MTATGDRTDGDTDDDAVGHATGDDPRDAGHGIAPRPTGPPERAPGAAKPEQRHVPVMLAEVLEALRPPLERSAEHAAGEREGNDGDRRGGRDRDADRNDERDAPLFVDATLGLGGHTEAILRAHPRARAVGIDRDTDAVAAATARLAPFGPRFHAVHAGYDDLLEVLASLGRRRADAILFDLGVSSLQLDEPERGFAYRTDTPLDMRMDQTQGITAAEVVNTYPAEELTRILRDHGEERFARKVAGAIVRARSEAPVTHSGRLVELLRQAIPAASQRSGGHPAKRTFQALRIEVNAELRALEDALPAAIEACAVGGRVAVLTYHSLEDRMVKKAFASGSAGTTPPGLPVELPEHAGYLRLVTRGGRTPTEQEITANPRAASARLRVAERIRATKGGTR